MKRTGYIVKSSGKAFEKSPRLRADSARRV